MYEEIMLYHDDSAVETYMANKEKYPDGMLD